MLVGKILNCAALVYLKLECRAYLYSLSKRDATGWQNGADVFDPVILCCTERALLICSFSSWNLGSTCFLLLIEYRNQWFLPQLTHHLSNIRFQILTFKMHKKFIQ